MSLCVHLKYIGVHVFHHPQTIFAQAMQERILLILLGHCIVYRMWGRPMMPGGQGVDRIGRV